MTDMDPDETIWFLRMQRARTEDIRAQIALEVADMTLTDLRAVVRMIEQWKGLKSEG